MYIFSCFNRIADKVLKPEDFEEMERASRGRGGGRGGRGGFGGRGGYRPQLGFTPNSHYRGGQRDAGPAGRHIRYNSSYKFVYVVIYCIQLKIEPVVLLCCALLIFPSNKTAYN